jgi:chemotaxis family two-component system sensor kinase Cph1
MTTSMEILVQRCESEQLHLSGAIQSFGALIRIDTGSGRVTHASANLADFLGVEAFKILGEPRESLPWLTAEILEELPDQPGTRVVIRDIVDRPDRKVDGLVIRGPGCILVELERRDTGFELLSVQQFQTPLLAVPYDDDELTEVYREMVGWISAEG